MNTSILEVCIDSKNSLAKGGNDNFLLLPMQSVNRLNLRIELLKTLRKPGVSLVSWSFPVIPACVT